MPEARSLDLIDIDTFEDQVLRDRIEEAKPDVVFNVAASGVSPANRSPAKLVDGNVGLLARILPLLESCPPRQFIHTGSWSEYSTVTHKMPLTEDYPISPDSVYGAAKASTTIYGMALARSLGCPFSILRLFHVYGVGEPKSRLIPYLVDQISHGKKAKLTSGQQTRDFIYIDDVVDAYIEAATSERLAPYSVYNVGSGVGVSVRDVAKIASDQMSSDGSLLGFGEVPDRVDEPSWVVSDIGKLLAATDWKPRISIEEGIQRMLASRSLDGDWKETGGETNRV